MRALITGGLGFVGAHLSRHLVDCRDDVAVSYLPDKADVTNSKTPELKKLEEQRKQFMPRQVQQVALDVTNREHLEQILTLMKPDVIYHLAALSFVPTSEDNSEVVYQVNTFGTLNLLESVKKCSPTSRVLVISSSEVYGVPRLASLPFSESSELRPFSTYGASKAASEMICHKFVARDNLQVVICRPFAHVGPLQEDRYSLSSFAKQIALIKLGKKPAVLEVGNLDVKRDFSDVSDIVRGYRECALNGRVGEIYNLCSGNPLLLSDLVNSLIKLAGVEIEIKVDESRLRSVDMPEHYGSNQKAAKEFGWKPRVEVEAFLGGLLTYWLETLNTK